MNLRLGKLKIGSDIKIIFTVETKIVHVNLHESVILILQKKLE